MLMTPIGSIIILINDIEVTYSFQPLSNLSPYSPNVSGRLSILVPLKEQAGENLEAIFLL